MKTQNFTLLGYQSPFKLSIVDNTSGVVTGKMDDNTFACFRYVLPDASYKWEIMSHGDHIFFASGYIPAAYGISVFNIPKKEMMQFPVKVPGFSWDDQGHMIIRSAGKHSETSVLYDLWMESRRGRKNVFVWLDVKQPTRMIILANPGHFGSMRFVPCHRGFFTVGDYAFPLDTRCRPSLNTPCSVWSFKY